MKLYMKFHIWNLLWLFEHGDDYKWKILNYKVADIFEIYNFHIQFPLFKFIWNMYDFFEIVL
jgi:hypothetical protein